MAHGGHRPGAGNKKGNAWGKTKEEKTAQELLREYLRPHIADIADALLKEGRKGDVPAVKEIFERAMGKTTIPVEHSGAILTSLTEEQRAILESLYEEDQPEGT